MATVNNFENAKISATVPRDQAYYHTVFILPPSTTGATGGGGVAPPTTGQILPRGHS